MFNARSIVLLELGPLGESAPQPVVLELEAEPDQCQLFHNLEEQSVPSQLRVVHATLALAQLIVLLAIGNLGLHVIQLVEKASKVEPVKSSPNPPSVEQVAQKRLKLKLVNPSHALLIVL